MASVHTYYEGKVLMPILNPAEPGQKSVCFLGDIIHQWMDGEPKDYRDCVLFLTEMVENVNLKFTVRKLYECIEYLDNVWHGDNSVPPKNS
jgi:hypothetical protein